MWDANAPEYFDTLHSKQTNGDLASCEQMLQELTTAIKEEIDNQKKAELLWRQARACFDIQDCKLDDKAICEKWICDGIASAEAAIEADPENGFGHKWLAIMLGALGPMLGISDKIAGDYRIKEHADKAATYGGCLPEARSSGMVAVRLLSGAEVAVDLKAGDDISELRVRVAEALNSGVGSVRLVQDGHELTGTEAPHDTDAEITAVLNKDSTPAGTFEFFECNRAVDLRLMKDVSFWPGYARITGHMEGTREHSSIVVSNADFEKFKTKKREIAAARRERRGGSCGWGWTPKLVVEKRKTLLGGTYFAVLDVTFHKGRFCRAK